MILLYFLIGLVIAIFYVISPYDLIPDTLGLFGYIDDLAVVISLIIYVINGFYGRFRDRVEQDYRNIHSE